MPLSVTAIARPIVNFADLAQTADEVFKLRRTVQNLEQSKQAFEQFRTAANAQLQEKQRLIDLVDQKLGRVSNTANNALSKANKIDDLVDGFADVRRRVDSVQGAVNTTARRVDDIADIAQGASKKAFDALGAASKVLNLLAVIGGAAGLLALFGYFKAVKPTLDAHESRLDSHDKAFSDVYGVIGSVDGRARSAQTAAAAAKNTADQASNAAKSAALAASNADKKADRAIANSNSAVERADEAVNTSNTAIRETRANANEIERIKREGVPMSPEQYGNLLKQHRAEQGQNQEMIELVKRLPTYQNDGFKIPYELLGLPPLIRGLYPAVNSAASNAATAANNTSRSNLEAAAAAGTCQAFQPNSCGDRSIQRNVNPLKNTLDAILKKVNGIGAGLSAATLARVNVAIAKIDSLNTTVLNKFAKTWEYLKIDRVLNLLSTAASIHNASMLSYNVLQSLGDTIAAVLSIVGIRNAEGQPFDLGQILKGSANSFITTILGAEAAAGLSERWNKLNRIITAGSAVVMAVRSVQWAIAEGIEIIGGWIAHIGNGLRESGTVADRQYPWMDAGIKIKNFSQLDKWNQGLESAENITNQVYSTVAAGQEIAQTVSEVRTAKDNFDTEFETKLSDADLDLTNRENESKSPDLDNLDLIKIEEVEE